MPELAVMRAAARAAYSTSGLKVEMCSAIETDLDGIAPLVDAMHDAMLVVPFVAPDEAEGFVALSQDFAQSLIEKATTGRLAGLPIEARRASSIDLLLCRDFLHRFLETWREIAQGSPQLDWLEGYAPQDRAMDLDLMGLNCRDMAYRMFTVALRLDDKRDAALLVAFPKDRHPRREIETNPPKDASGGWGAIWRDAVLDTTADLDAVLARLSVPLSTVRAWRIGDRLDIPAAALSGVTLGRRGGAIVASARLGQAQGYRALCLNTLRGNGKGSAVSSDAEPVIAEPEFHPTQSDTSPALTESPNPTSLPARDVRAPGPDASPEDRGAAPG
jgi:flagellar motor switch protein FliM